MKVVEQGLWLCDECMQAAVNDDYTALDYSHPEPEATRRMGDIRQGLKDLGPGLIPDFRDEIEFECECGWVGPSTEVIILEVLGENTDLCPKCGEPVEVREQGVKEFSMGSCDCCGLTAAGARYRFARIQEDGVCTSMQQS